MSDNTGSNETRLVAHLVPKAGKEAELAAAIKEILPDVLGEPGCITYIAHESREHPGTIVMYEAWESDAMLDAHVAAGPFMKLAAQFEDLLGEPLRLEHLRELC